MTSRSSPYTQAHYTEVLNAIIETYALDKDRISPHQYLVWRTQIKRLFDKGYLIREIVAALTEAGEKKKWPLNTALFHRIEDVILLHRRPLPTIKKDGIFSIKDILKPH